MQVKKKAAKKTYSAAKKGFPKTKITLEDLLALHAKTEASIDRLSAAHAKTEAAQAKTEAAIDRLSAAHAKTEASIDRLSAVQAKTEASIDRLSAENRLLAAENRKTSEAVRQLHAEVSETSAKVSETSEAVRQLNDTLGGMGGHLGEVIEFIVIPKIRPVINALGNHSFKEITARKIVETVINDRKRKLTEVDVLLYGDTEVMAVEIKTCLQTSDVDKHLDRLQKLRDHEVDAEVKGKTLFGAVVGAIVHEPIRAYALKKGLYVIEIREEEDKLNIEKPDTCRTW